MADEKIILTEIDFNTDEAVKATIQLKEEIALLKAQTEKAKKETGETSDEFIKYNASLKATQARLRQQENVLKKVNEANDSQTGSIKQLRAQLSVVTNQWAELSEEERLNTERGQNLVKQKLELTEALKAEEKATGDSRRNVGNYSEALEGLGGGFGQAIQGAKGLGKQFLKLLANPIVALIAAITGALVALFKAFKRTEEGGNAIADTFAKITGAIDAVLGRLGKLAKGIVDVVKGEKQIKDLKGTFSGLKDEIIATANAAAELNKLERAVIKLTNETKLAVAEFAKLSEEQSAIADDATLSFQKRTAAEEEARKNSIALAELNVDLAEKELELLTKRLEQNQRVNKFDQELINQQVDAQAALIQAQTELTRVTFENAKRRREISQDNFEQELDFLIDLADNQKTINEQQINDSTRSLNQRKEILTETENLLNQSFNQQITLFQTQFDVLIDTNKLLKLNNKESFEYVRSLELSEIATNRLLEVIRERRLATQDLFVAQKDLESESIQAVIDLEVQRLGIVKNAELETAELIGIETQKINEKYAKAELELEKATFDAKLALAFNFVSNVANAAGEGSAISKAAAISEATISTYLGAQQAFAAAQIIPPPFGQIIGIANAAAAVATGVANVRKILSVSTPGTSSVGISSPGISQTGTGASSSVSIPQNVNPEIGQGIVTRDLGIKEQQTVIEKQPVLIEDNVTAAQNSTTQRQETQVL